MNGSEANRVYTISSINRLPPEDKRQIYSRVIPDEIYTKFGIDRKRLVLEDVDLLKLKAPPGSVTVEVELRHTPDFPDPVLYGHLEDTLSGHIHILLYVLNDPGSPRFDVDRLPDGRPTKFGTLARNMEAELAALCYGLAPGQVRRGLRLLGSAIQAFERLIESLGQDLYFAEPLYYHTAVLFEHYGFAYQKGLKLMERIQKGFDEGGDLIPLLDDSTPFRSPQAAHSVRLRSWAIHDNMLGEPFTDVTMYKRVGKSSGVSTCGECDW
jgi:hypothetical protein